MGVPRGFPRAAGLPSAWEAPFELGVPMGFLEASQELHASLQHAKPCFELGVPKGFLRATGLPSAWEAPLQTGSS
ncbi:hypothetical protein GUJ93_ZPchr0004g39006 [Zizania palustris]|uniref:Uncharacterized protein n=1 Tax=Zizania palustris TaxID=103762 RepID=A0A8J5SGB9_ZIZPA|nr:hypothetical protein GUJ93_ZPchr0004g39006 [Zizania palustris]